MKAVPKNFYCESCKRETYSDYNICANCGELESIKPLPKDIYMCYLNGSLYGSGDLDHIHELFKDYFITCKMYGRSECDFKVVKYNPLTKATVEKDEGKTTSKFVSSFDAGDIFLQVGKFYTSTHETTGFEITHIKLISESQPTVTVYGRKVNLHTQDWIARFINENDTWKSENGWLFNVV